VALRLHINIGGPLGPICYFFLPNGKINRKGEVGHWPTASEQLALMFIRLCLSYDLTLFSLKYCLVRVFLQVFVSDLGVPQLELWNIFSWLGTNFSEKRM